MRCGKCKATDVTVDHVRGCYSGRPQAEPADVESQRAWLDRMNEKAAVQAREREEDEVVAAFKAKRDSANGPMWPASDKQIDYLINILQPSKVWPSDWVELSEADARGMERDDVSRKITTLRNQPYIKKTGKTNGEEWTMPEGRYALDIDGDIRFYQVTKPTEGRWSGYTFIVVLVGAPGSYRKIKMASSERFRILKLIEADPKEAMIRYGLESNVCGRCQSPLTDADSRARGLGPICASKSGWF